MVGVEEGIISRSCLRDWNPQRLSSRHMVRSIPSTAPAPVTLRLRSPTHPPPSTLALLGGGQAMSLSCSPIAIHLLSWHFPFPPTFFTYFSPKNILSFAFTPPPAPPPLFFLAVQKKKHGGVDSETCFPNLFPPSCHADGRWKINQRGRAATWPDSRPWVGGRRAAPCH